MAGNAGPVSDKARIAELDVLRGFALLVAAIPHLRYSERIPIRTPSSANPMPTPASTPPTGKPVKSSTTSVRSIR